MSEPSQPPILLSKKAWKYAPIGEVCVTSAGGTPLKLDSKNYDGGTIPWLMSGEVGQRDIETATKFITDAGLANSSAKLFPPSSVLIAMYGATAGEVGILRFKAATNQAVCAILPVQAFIPEFIYYFLLSRQKQLVATATGNAQPNISQAKIRALKLPILPREEQERIVALLDEAFEAISTSAINAKTNIQKAQAVFDSLLANTFGRRASHWRTEAVSKVAKHNLGKMLDKAKNRGTLNPYLRNLNVRWFEFDLSDLNEMPFLPEEVARYSIVKGDVVICEGGDPGRAAIWPNDDSIYFQKALHRVRFTNPMLSKWFVYYLYSQHRMGLLKQWFTGSGIAHFTGEALGTC
jgi:type I restriction enzyme S subunit